METAQWPLQVINNQINRSIFISMPFSSSPSFQISPSPPFSSEDEGVERRVRPHKEKALNCPRCSSTHTKFCYYNNYSLSQPRYFCKSCRRYWTEGGSLRNVPVGGGSRKNKRSYNSSSSSSLPSSTITTVASTASTASLLSSSSSSSSRNLQPSKLLPHELTSIVSLSSSVSALEPIRSGISSRKLISFDAPNSSKEIERSTNARIKLRTSSPSQSLYWQELRAVNMEELMWPSKVMLPLEHGAGNVEERKEGGEGNQLALPFQDLKQQVTDKKVCDDIVEGGEDPTLFWEGIMRNGGGGGGGGGW